MSAADVPIPSSDDEGENMDLQKLHELEMANFLNDDDDDDDSKAAETVISEGVSNGVSNRSSAAKWLDEPDTAVEPERQVEKHVVELVDDSNDKEAESKGAAEWLDNDKVVDLQLSKVLDAPTPLQLSEVLGTPAPSDPRVAPWNSLDAAAAWGWEVGIGAAANDWQNWMGGSTWDWHAHAYAQNGMMRDSMGWTPANQQHQEWGHWPQYQSEAVNMQSSAWKPDENTWSHAQVLRLEDKVEGAASSIRGEQKQVGEQKQLGEPSRRHAAICKSTYALLINPPPELLVDEEGFSPIMGKNGILDVCLDLRNSTFGNSKVAVKAIVNQPDCGLVVDGERGLIRLETNHEYIQRLVLNFVENYSCSSASQCVPFDMLLNYPDLRAALACECSARIGRSETQVLEAMLADSPLLTIDAGHVAKRSLHLQLRFAVESMLLPASLARDQKTATVIDRDGELPLSYLAAHPRVESVLNSITAEQPGRSHDQIAILREALRDSPSLKLDDGQLSVRPLLLDTRSLHGSSHPEVTGHSNGGLTDNKGPKRFSMKSDGDAKRLRALFKFYFEHFNLQNNRALLDLAEKHYLTHPRNTWPCFDVDELCSLPRLRRLVERYIGEDRAHLLNGVFATDEELPVKLFESPGSAKFSQRKFQITLTYEPRLRYVVATSPEYKDIWAPQSDLRAPRAPIDSSTACFVSYSISSDLSNSSKATLNLGVDPTLLDWDNRLQRIRRQLLLYEPDVICMQGVQGIGSRVRCSEEILSWFARVEEESASNHAGRFYLELSKDNYGLIYTPAFEVANGGGTSIGSVILWKRSRWRLSHLLGTGDDVAPIPGAAIASLQAQHGGSSLVVCSAKPPASYELESAAHLPSELGKAQAKKVLEALKMIDAGVRTVNSPGSHRLLCGDLALETSLLPDGLLVAGDGYWTDTYEAMLGATPWTKFGLAPNAVDFMLHSEDLRPLTILGPMPGTSMPLAEALSLGHPSDHLMLVAAFSMAKAENAGSTLSGIGIHQ